MLRALSFSSFGRSIRQLLILFPLSHAIWRAEPVEIITGGRSVGVHSHLQIPQSYVKQLNTDWAH